MSALVCVGGCDVWRSQSGALYVMNSVLLTPVAVAKSVHKLYAPPQVGATMKHAHSGGVTTKHAHSASKFNYV